MKIKNQKI